jgi:hypothetical protein
MIGTLSNPLSQVKQLFIEVDSLTNI